MNNWKNHKKFNFTKQSHKLTLMLRVFLMVLFVFINCFVPRDHQQITFVMLNRFCLLCETSHPLLTMEISSLMEYKAKLNEKYMPVLHCISSLKGTSYKIFFLSCCFIQVLNKPISFFTSFLNFI